MIIPLFGTAQNVIVYAEQEMYYEIFVDKESILQDKGSFSFTVNDNVPAFEVYIPQAKQRLRKMPKDIAGVHVYAIYQKSEGQYALGFRGLFDSIGAIPLVLQNEIKSSKTFLTKPKNDLGIKAIISEMATQAEADSSEISKEKKPQPRLDFAQGMEILKSQSSDVRRLILMKEWFRYPEYIQFPNPTLDQIRQLTHTLSNDGATLDLLVFLYKYTQNQDQYHLLKDALQFNMSQTLFIDRLTTIRQEELANDTTLNPPTIQEKIYESEIDIP